MVQERKNRLMAYRVENGLRVQKLVSTRAAAAYLANYGVPMHVSIRVLGSPNKRAPNEYHDEPTWFEIIMASGPTYGAKMEFF